MPKQYETGMYYADKVKCGFGESDKTGTPYFFIEFLPKHFAKDGKWTDVVTPEPRTTWIYLSDKSSDRGLETMKDLGFNGKFDSEADISGDENGGITIGCSQEVYEGKVKERWQLAGSGGGSITHKPVGSDKIRHLNNLWRAANPDGAKRPLPPPPPTSEPLPF